MKINWRLPIAIAIIVIISLWTIMLLRSTAATGSAAFANPALSSTVLNITLLVTAVIASGPLLYIISSARAYVKRTTSGADQARTGTTAAPIIAKVKSHPLPTLWR